MSGQVERDDESCEEVVCVLEWNISLGQGEESRVITSKDRWRIP